MRWTGLCPKTLNWLDDMVPNNSVNFNFDDLVLEYDSQKAGGNDGPKCWIPHMNDCAMTDRHHIYDEIKENESGGRWRRKWAWIAQQIAHTPSLQIDWVWNFW